MINKTTIQTKSINGSLSAVEFNNLNDTVNLSVDEINNLSDKTEENRLNIDEFNSKISQVTNLTNGIIELATEGIDETKAATIAANNAIDIVFIQTQETIVAKNNAITATNLTTNATNLANEKASLADSKATLANDKATLADQKATLADQKATLANDAAATANQATIDTLLAKTTTENLNIAVTNAEGLRVTSEQGRVTAEGLRVTADSGRTIAEGLRVTAEGNRAGAEITRGTNEDTRQGNEVTRVSQESSRVIAENARVAAGYVTSPQFMQIIQLTQAQYDALTPKVATTLYIIIQA